MLSKKVIYLKKYRVAIYGRILLTDKFMPLGLISKLLNIVSFRIIIAEAKFSDENLNFIKSRYYGDRILHIGSQENLNFLANVSDKVVHAGELQYNGEFFSRKGFFLKKNLLSYSLNDLLVYIDCISPSAFENLFIGEDWTIKTPVYHDNMGVLEDMLFFRSLILHRISLVKAGMDTNITKPLKNFIPVITKNRQNIPTRILYETSLRIYDRFNYLYKDKPCMELEYILNSLPIHQNKLLLTSFSA